MRWTDWVVLGVLLALFGGSMFYPKTAGVSAFIVVGLTAINKEFWPRLGRAFHKYNEQIKMMPHM